MIRKLYPYARQYRRMILFCVLLTAGEVLCELMIPLFMSRIVDQGIPSGDLRYMSIIGAVMVGLSVLAIFFGVTNAKLSADASQGFAANLRKAMYDKTQSFSFSNIDKFSSASLITRMTNDVTRLQLSFMMSLRILTRAPFMLVSAFVIAVGINARLSLNIVVSIFLLLAAAVSIVKVAGKLFTEVQKRLDDLNGTVQENLIAIRVVKAFVREGYERTKFERVNKALEDISLKVGAITSIIMPLMMLVMNGTTLAVIWQGGRFVGLGEMQTGQLMSFLSYIMQILMSVMMFSMIIVMLTRAKASAVRAVEVLETQPDIRDQTGANAPVVQRGKVEFRNVHFRYDGHGGDKDVLDGISFTAQPGQLIGIIGGTGSGKTSLVSLIPRFYDVSEGAVLIDGVDVREYSQQTLRDSIGMVMQKNNLFSGTIKENLLWGNENATMEEIVQAAKDAQAHDFIESFPDGYDTGLDQGGVNVSGGQKQRLCIARAMMKKPPILIFDDSTSAVDTATEARIRQSFYENFRDSTVIIVAQRISSVQAADQIIVLDDGEICGMGTHDELMEQSEVYREIYTSQTEGSVA